MNKNRYTLHTEMRGRCTIDRYQNQSGIHVNTDDCGVSYYVFLPHEANVDC
jgi:hypothetical protein